MRRSRNARKKSAKSKRAQKELERLRRPKPRDDTRDDIGPNSRGETERLRARNEELERENHRLARENLALRSEIDELKAELARRAPADDGLDIPESLRRRTATHG